MFRLFMYKNTDKLILLYSGDISKVEDSVNNESRSVIIVDLVTGIFLCILISLAILVLKNQRVNDKLTSLTYTKIHTAEDLANIKNDPKGHYILKADIDMTGVTWTPFTFEGTLDGDGHKIKNLKVLTVGNARETTYDGNMKGYDTCFAAMFDVLRGGKVKNLTLENYEAEITSDQPCFAGSIAGFTDNALVRDCKVSGKITLRAHDRMFGTGGIAGYGTGRFESVDSDMVLICIDTDRANKDEQFMGGALAAGFPDLVKCNIRIDGYASEHGYAHNGGLIGLYMIYPKGYQYEGTFDTNNVTGKITFFEDNEDRRAYCKPFVGELMNRIIHERNNTHSFESKEVFTYDTDLMPA